MGRFTKQFGMFFAASQKLQFQVRQFCCGVKVTSEFSRPSKEERG
jgi:hypothetical protein